MRKLLLSIVFTIIIINLFGFETGKNPTKAMALSAFIPGGGQFYNESYHKAFTVIALEGYFIGRLIYNHNLVNKYYDKADKATGDDIFKYQQKYNEYFDRRQNDYWWLGSIVILSVLDAFVDANMYNYKEEKDSVFLLFEENKIGISFRW